MRLPAYLPMCSYVCVLFQMFFFLYNNNYISFRRSANSASISCCSHFMRYMYTSCIVLLLPTADGYNMYARCTYII